MLLFLRCLVLAVTFPLVAVLGIILCLLRPFHPDNTRVCGHLFSRVGCAVLGINVVVKKGAEYIQDHAPGVVIANHQSNLDLFVLGGVVPSRTVSVGKKSLAYLPFFGQVYWLAGNILIDRAKAKKSLDVMRQVADAIRTKRITVWVFPEGTRNASETLLPFKKGAFLMAKEANAPIYPVCASRYVGKLNFNRWHAGTIEIEWMPPILAVDNQQEDSSVLMEEARQSMQTVLSTLETRPH